MELGESAIWDKPEVAQELGRERVNLERVVKTIERMNSGLNDCRDLLQLAQDEDDEALLGEVSI